MTQRQTYFSRALFLTAQFDYLNHLVLVGIKWIRGIVYVAEYSVIGQAGTFGRFRKHWFQNSCSRELVGKLNYCRKKEGNGAKN